MFEQLFSQFLGLAGVSALIAALVNVLKTFGVLKDGQAPKVALVLSVAGFVALVAFQVFLPSVNVSGLDYQASLIAEKLVYILGFAVQMGLPALFHRFFVDAELPIVGKSFTADTFK